MPPELTESFDVACTDPPYTVAGATLFLSRAVSALRRQPGQHVFFSFGARRPAETLDTQRLIADLGLTVRALIPNFNSYVGVGILAGASNLYHLRSTEETAPLIESGYDGPLYTADTRPEPNPPLPLRHLRHDPRGRIDDQLAGHRRPQISWLPLLRRQHLPPPTQTPTLNRQDHLVDRFTPGLMIKEVDSWRQGPRLGVGGPACVAWMLVARVSAAEVRGPACVAGSVPGRTGPGAAGFWVVVESWPHGRRKLSTIIEFCPF